LLKSFWKETENSAPINTPSPDNYRFITYRELVHKKFQQHKLEKGSFGSCTKDV